jgi:hypothetical protein
MSEFFDYQTLASRLRIDTHRLAELETIVRSQYGSDQMLFELRMLRTLRAIDAGKTTIEAAIEELQEQTARPAVV